jgi:hypothetical protein
MAKKAKTYQNDYGTIEFQEKFNMTFDQFKSVYEETHIFCNFHPKEREVEMKKAFSVATGKETEKE